MITPHPPVHVSAATVKLVVSGALAAAVTWVGILGYQYYTTRKPVTSLPGVPPVAQQVLPKTPPRFLSGFYGPKDSPLTGAFATAISPDGQRLYVTLASGSRSVIVLDRAGERIGELAPPETTGSGRLPLFIAVDPAGQVYVADRFRARIDIFSPRGDYVGPFTAAEPRDTPIAPMGVAFDRDGDLYVTDLKAGEHRLLVYAPDRTLRLKIGKEGEQPGEFSFPSGVAVGRDGRIYVADSNNGRVQVLDPAGRLVDMIGRGGRGGLGVPRGLALDDDGRLFIADMTGDSVQVWDVTGAEPKLLHTVEDAGGTDGPLSHPNGVAVDVTGRIYVADRGGSRVQVWSY